MRGTAPREARLLRVLTPWITPGSLMLDVGAGSGLLAQALCDAVAVRPTLVDVVANNRTPLPFVLYDGARLPFRDLSFDVALIAFVLHHASDPDQVLTEARRVGRRLVILEDTYRSTVERTAASWIDWIQNRGQGVAPAWGRFTPDGWMEFFTRYGRPVHTEEIPPKWLGVFRDSIRHLLVVL